MKRCLILFTVISLFFSISCGSSSSSLSIPKSFNMISSVPAASRLNSNKDLVMVRSNANKIEDAKDLVLSRYYSLCAVANPIYRDFNKKLSKDFESAYRSLAIDNRIPYVIWSWDESGEYIPSKLKNASASVSEDVYYTGTAEENNIDHKVIGEGLAYYFYPMTELEKKAVVPGISVRNLDDEEKAQYAGRVGAVVDVVYFESAAEKAGIKKGDVIILFNNQKISNADDYRLQQSKISEKDTIYMEFLRGESQFTATFTH